MNISEITILVLAALPILYRAFMGWRYGIGVEIRSLLFLLFGTLVAFRYWQFFTESISGSVTFDARWVAIGVFLALFLAGSFVSAVVIRAKWPLYQSVKKNYADNVLGLLGGIFSGALVAAVILWVGSVASPGKFENVPYAKAVMELPEEVIGSLETVAGVAPGSAGRTKYPAVTLVETPLDPATSKEVAPEGAVLMVMRGKITWD